MNDHNQLLFALDKLHTTILGDERIRKNINLDISDVVDWAKNIIKQKDSIITKNGKNWYVSNNNCIITINSYSYTIITAHKI